MKSKTLLIFTLLLAACSQSSDIGGETVESTTTTEKKVEVKENLDASQVDDELLISDNFNSFYDGITLKDGPDFNVQVVSDLDIFDENLYFVTGLYEGKIYKYNPKTSEMGLFLDISEKIIVTEDKNNEMGLLSMELHPSSEYFLISYVNKSMRLTVEQHYINKETLMLQNIEANEILSVQYFDKVHFSANLLYSEFYDGFIFTVGDGLGDNLGLRGDSIYSYINRGKILLLLSSRNNDIVNPIISYGVTENKNTILAYGVRNPWGIGLLEEKLYVPDVGRSTYEEVSILDLPTEEPVFLGYPIYEGPLKSNFQLNEIYSWNSGVKSSAEDFLNKKYQPPEIFYKHTESENGYRCAVIGGAVVENVDHDIWNNTFNFVDYCTKELFTYNHSKKIFIASVIPLDVNNLYISKLVHLDDLSFLLLGFTYEVKDGEYFVRNKNFIIELPKVLSFSEK
jgi:hypothetical protein